MKKIQTKNCCYLYRHIRLDTLVPFYIGIGSDLNFKRAYSKERRNKHWHSIVAKSSYRVEILLKDLSWEEVCKKECQFIKIHGRSDLNLGTLCNLTNGGDGTRGVIISQETKIKISKATKGENNGMFGKKHTKESLLKISKTSEGRIKSLESIEKWKKNMSFIKSIQTIEKIKQSLTGKKHTEERKENQRKAHLGKKLSEEAKKKLSDFWKGKPKGLFSEEHKNKLSEARKRYIARQNLSKIQSAA